MSEPDYPDWQTPYAHANAMKNAQLGVTTEIAALVATGSPTGTPGGAPIVHNKQSLILQANAGLGQGRTDSWAGSFLRAGYQFWISADTTLPSATSMVTVKLKFEDFASGDILDEEWFSFWAGLQVSSGAPSGDCIVVGRGATRGDRLLVDVKNAAGTGILSYSLAVFEAGTWQERDYQKHRVFAATSSGYNLPSSDIRHGILAANFFASQAANTSTAKDQLPLYHGRAMLHFDSASLTNDCDLTISALDDPDVTLATGVSFFGATDVNGKSNIEVSLPAVQCFLTMTNRNAAAKTLKYTLTALDY